MGEAEKCYSEEKKFLYLLGCALNEREPQKEMVEDYVWPLMWNMSVCNNVEAIVWQGIKSLKDIIPTDLYKKWEEAAKKTLYRQLIFDAERTLIVDKMNKEDVDWLPLKGINIQQMYPKPGMRYMCDNDILYREQKIEKDQEGKVVEAIMTKCGFRKEGVGGNHDVYQKKPILNFELHKDLVPTSAFAYQYYKDPWEKAVKNEDSSNGYHFKIEDEYIFMIVHSYKHYKGSGCGVRILTDEYVFLKEKGTKMNWKYIQDELQKIGIEEYEQELRMLAVNVFKNGEQLTSKAKEMIHYLVSNGTYGTLETKIKNKIEVIENKNKKLIYVRERILLSELEMKEYYPFFYKHRLLRACLPVVRLLKGMIKHPFKLYKEMIILRKM